MYQWIETQVNRFGVWATAIGSLWAFMSWAASNIGPLAGYGWGTFVFAGFLAVCVFVLVISATLAAWRYFLPLAAPAIDSKAIEHNVLVVQPSAWNTPIDEIARNRLNDKVRVVGRTMFVLVTMEIERLERGIIARLIHDDSGPGDENMNDDSMKQQKLLLDHYFNSVSGNLSGTKWRQDLTYVLLDAENVEDHRLKEERPEPPPTVNAYIFRDYSIAMAKRRRVLEYLKKSHEESESQELRYLSRLREEIKHLDPQIFNQN